MKPASNKSKQTKKSTKKSISPLVNYGNNIKAYVFARNAIIRKLKTPIWKRYCTGKGLEIGGGAHNTFGLDTLNVDVKSDNYQAYVDEQMENCGKVMPIDILADTSEIPVPNESYNFIISSHVFEHVANPIKVLKEWNRIIKPGGIIFMIIPHKNRTGEKDRERTTLAHLIADSNNDAKGDQDHAHAWITEDIVVLIDYMIKKLKMNWKLEAIEDADSKVGNGFTIVVKKLAK